MGVARRLYLYAVSSFSLLVLATGLYLLVALVVGEAADALGSSLLGGDDVGREQVSLAIALVIVGTPLFAIHWTLVGRGWRGAGASGREDRHSALRAFHMAFVATVALLFATQAANQVLARAFGAILGVDDSFGPRISDSVAVLAVAIPIWWYHQRRRNLDIRHDQLTNAAAWLTRFHRYVWAFAGLMLLLVGASQVLQTVASELIDRQAFGNDGDAWLGALAGSLAWIIVGAVVLWIHASDARGAIRDAAIIGEDDRASALRGAYFGAVVLVSLGFVAVAVATAIAELGRFAIGAGDATGPGDLLELAVGPMLVAVPFAIGGWLHWTAQRREAAGRSPAALAGAERLGLHLAALVGLTFLAVSSAQVLGRLFDLALGGARVDDFARYELAWFVAQIVVGAALWLPAWTAILRRRSADPLVERRAAAGRAYLYLVVGAAVIAAVPSAAFALFRVIDRILGGSGSDGSSELAIPVAVLIVATIVAAYHGRLVVQDLRFTAVVDASDTAATAEAGTPVADLGEAASASIAATPATRVLPEAGTSLAIIVRGPEGTDLAAVVAGLREHVPAGVVLDTGGG